MSATDTDTALSELASGLDEELALLRELRDLSERQQAALAANDVNVLDASRVARDRVMAALLTVHARLAPLRSGMDRADRGSPELAAIRTRQQDVDSLIRDILRRDRGTVAAAQAANLARDQEVRALESGNTTLAAYRRGLALATNPAAIVSQHA